MAPEVVSAPLGGNGASDRKRLTPAADLWSLGVILYEFLHFGRTALQKYKAQGRVAFLNALEML